MMSTKKRKLNPTEIGPDCKLLVSMFLRRRDLYNLGCVTKSWAAITKDRRLQEVEKRKFLECVMDIAELRAIERWRLRETDLFWDEFDADFFRDDIDENRICYYVSMVINTLKPSYNVYWEYPGILVDTIRNTFESLPPMRCPAAKRHVEYHDYSRLCKSARKPNYPCIRNVALNKNKCLLDKTPHPWDLD